MTRHTPQYLQAGTYPADDDRRLIGALWPTPASSGCAVTAEPAAMKVNIAPGQVAVPTPNNTGSILCTSDAVEQVDVPPAPGSGLNRYDMVICQVRSGDIGVGTGDDFIFNVVSGGAVASPVPPTGPPQGSVALAHIYVPGNSAAVDPANITDRRPFALAVSPGSVMPPPLASTDPFRSFTDASGEVWVARGAIAGGVWRRARDVLRCRFHREAPATGANTAWQDIALNIGEYDNYQLYNANTGVITLPLPGNWRISMQIGVSATASNQYCQCGIWDYPGGTWPRSNGSAFASNTFAMTARAHRLFAQSAAGKQFVTRWLTAPGLAMNIPASWPDGQNFLEVVYDSPL
jgi:hypothetical protein